MVQNAAAHILTGGGRLEHITSVLAYLHWLPVQVQADFRVLLLTYEILNSTAPSYLSNLMKPYFCAPTFWNSPPLDIMQACSVVIFKAKLKTHLFSLTYNSWAMLTCVF